MTIKEFLEEIDKVFAKSGIECSRQEALMLVCHVLSADSVYLFTHMNEYVDEKLLLAAAALVNERCGGRPLAYILGTANFYGIDLTVDERVLIPRPETELIAKEAIDFAAENYACAGILDICTGSGCISAALAENIESCSITASDVSLKALQIANHNLSKYKNVRVMRSDLFDKIGEKFDIIVSNPPYVASAARQKLQREVRDFEPELALFAGEDGLDILKRLIPEAAEHLNSGGLFLCEIGDDQGEAALALAKNTAQYYEESIQKDLCGRDRYLRARKL